MLRAVDISEEVDAKLKKLAPALDSFEAALETAEAMLIRCGGLRCGPDTFALKNECFTRFFAEVLLEGVSASYHLYRDTTACQVTLCKCLCVALR